MRLGGDDGAELVVAQKRLHRDYGGSSRYHDLALLLLPEPVPLSATVMPACLGPATFDPEVPFKSNLTGCQTVQIVSGEVAKMLG